MRSLERDIPSHLMADPHPLWWFGFQPQGTEVPDIHASNPWWWHNADVTPFPHDIFLSVFPCRGGGATLYTVDAKGPPIPVEESMLRAPTSETMVRHSIMVEEMLRRRRR